MIAQRSGELLQLKTLDYFKDTLFRKRPVGAGAAAAATAAPPAAAAAAAAPGGGGGAHTSEPYVVFFKCEGTSLEDLDSALLQIRVKVSRPLI